MVDRLQATYPSSFGMKIFVPSGFDLLGNSVSVSALKVLFELFASSTRDDYIMEKAGEIGSRSIRHLKALARHIEESGTELSIDWRDYSGIKHDWKVGPEKAKLMVRTIDKIAQTRSELIEVQGRLVGASLMRDRFELLSGDILYRGKFIASQSRSVQDLFGQEISVVLEETEITDLASNEKRSYFTLTEIH
jgi:predicted nucleotidyltransferase